MAKKLRDYKNLIKFIENNKCFEISGEKLFCNACDECKEYNPKEGIRALKRHIITKKHLDSVNRKKMQTRLNVLNTGDKLKNFHMKLINSFVSANIPLNKLEKPILKQFLEEISGNKIKSISSYRNSTFYDLKLYELQEHYKAMNDLYLVFDESTDCCGRYVLNILLGECNLSFRCRPHLIKCIELEKTNAANITKEIINKIMSFLEDLIWKCYRK